MKRIFSVFILCTIIAAGGLTGCKKAPKTVTPIEGGTKVSIGSKPAPLIPGTGQNGLTPGTPFNPNDRIGSEPIGQSGNNGESSSPAARPEGTENAEILQAQTVYFDFDKSTIRQSEYPKLEAVAAYLKNNPNARLKIAGNCDERGTEEYNRSLGERRALAALDYLVKQLGIDASRITTVSNGEDVPVDSGNDESAWAKNRRDEFIVITP